jgi:aminoglycoside 6'-N-acetyltransferase
MIFDTPRLIARRFNPRDLDDFVAMRNDADVARYQSWSAYSDAEGREFLHWMAARNPGDKGWFQFALEDKASGSFIGDCGLRIMETDARLAQIGYTIAKANWNKGFATEAVTALVAHAFATLPLHRITASADARNTASCRVLEKSGFTREALFRQSEWFKGEWADDAVYAILRGGPPAT